MTVLISLSVLKKAYKNGKTNSEANAAPESIIISNNDERNGNVSNPRTIIREISYEDRPLPIREEISIHGREFISNDNNQGREFIQDDNNHGREVIPLDNNEILY